MHLPTSLFSATRWIEQLFLRSSATQTASKKSSRGLRGRNTKSAFRAGPRTKDKGVWPFEFLACTSPPQVETSHRIICTIGERLMGPMFRGQEFQSSAESSSSKQPNDSSSSSDSSSSPKSSSVFSSSAADVLRHTTAVRRGVDPCLSAALTSAPNSIRSSTVFLLPYRQAKWRGVHTPYKSLTSMMHFSYAIVVRVNVNLIRREDVGSILYQ